jgi:hypothetical protein
MPDTTVPKNYREIQFYTKNGQVTVAGLANPIRYNIHEYSDGKKYSHDDEVIHFLKTQGFKTLISLDSNTEHTLSSKYSDVDIIKDTAKKYKLQHIHIPYPDFTAPSLEMFNQVINTVSNPKNGNVAIHCGAGYGRTGTMLAALALNEIILNAVNTRPDLLAKYNPDKLKTSITDDKNNTISVSTFVAAAIDTVRAYDIEQEQSKKKESSVETEEQIRALMALEKQLIQKALGYGTPSVSSSATEVVHQTPLKSALDTIMPASASSSDVQQSISLPPILSLFLNPDNPDDLDYIDYYTVVASSAYSSDTQQSLLQPTEKNVSHLSKPICAAYSPASVSDRYTAKPSPAELDLVWGHEQKQRPSK